MQPDVRISTIAHVIQLAVAPVFLLTGIASLLAVLTNRLARVIDRARLLEGRLPDFTGEHRTHMHGDLAMLSRRARYINLAISLCTTAALLVCIVVAMLFVSAYVSRDLSIVIAGLFVVAMICVISGLLSFLREVSLATQSLRIGPH